MQCNQDKDGNQERSAPDVWPCHRIANASIAAFLALLNASVLTRTNQLAVCDEGTLSPEDQADLARLTDDAEENDVLMFGSDHSIWEVRDGKVFKVR